MVGFFDCLFFRLAACNCCPNNCRDSFDSFDCNLSFLRLRFMPLFNDLIRISLSRLSRLLARSSRLSRFSCNVSVLSARVAARSARASSRSRNLLRSRRSAAAKFADRTSRAKFMPMPNPLENDSDMLRWFCYPKNIAHSFTKCGSPCHASNTAGQRRQPQPSSHASHLAKRTALRG